MLAYTFLNASIKILKQKFFDQVEFVNFFKIFWIKKIYNLCYNHKHVLKLIALFMCYVLMCTVIFQVYKTYFCVNFYVIEQDSKYVSP